MPTQEALINTIRRQKAKYCRFVDTKNWDGFSSLFVERPSLHFYAPDGELLYEFNDRYEYVRAASTFLEGARTIHQVHNDEIDIISDTEIRAIWSMEDYLFLAPGNDRPKSIHGYGHYHETWRLTDGNWCITNIELRRTILETIPADSSH